VLLASDQTRSTAYLHRQSPAPADVGKGHDVCFAWFVAEPNHDELVHIGELIDAGQLQFI